MATTAENIVVLGQGRATPLAAPYGAGAPAAHNPLSLERQCALARTLQTTLDIVELITVFAQEVRSDIPHEGLRYHNEGDGEAPGEGLDRYDVLVGREAPHTVSYELSILDQSLGTLALYGSEPFSTHQIETFEALLVHALHPLRNTLLYSRAIRTALRDPLTGVQNRGALDSAIVREVSFAQRHGDALAVLMVDVDHFKRINDDFGHLVGDAVLVDIARILKDCARDSDQVFRYGGEEFVVLLGKSDAAGARLVAERIRTAVSNYCFDGCPCRVKATVSIGVTALTPDDTSRSILDRADRLLYTAKDSGRDRVIAD